MLRGGISLVLTIGDCVRFRTWLARLSAAADLRCLSMGFPLHFCFKHALNLAECNPALEALAYRAGNRHPMRVVGASLAVVLLHDRTTGVLPDPYNNTNTMHRSRS
ncbi:hypothetical protein D3C78_1184250 [compost metagenome]